MQYRISFRHRHIHLGRKVLMPCALVMLMLGMSACAKLPDARQSATIDQHLRTWLVHLPPAYRTDKPLPLVMAFHGHGDTAAGMAHMTHLDAIADRLGFIVVYPDGIDRSWAAGVNSPADQQGIDDVAFVGQLLQRLEKDYSIDTSRIVLTGFSNGAHLVQLLGCRLAGHLRAIVPVSGALATSEQPDCHPEHPLTVVEFHGTDDPVDPFPGGQIHLHGGGRVMPVDATLAFWAAQNACAPIPSTTAGPKKNGASLDRLQWNHCRASSVVLYRIDGGGHTWPGGPQYLPAFMIGKATDVIDASNIIGQLATGDSP